MMTKEKIPGLKYPNNVLHINVVLLLSIIKIYGFKVISELLTSD